MKSDFVPTTAGSVLTHTVDCGDGELLEAVATLVPGGFEDGELTEARWIDSYYEGDHNDWYDSLNPTGKQVESVFIAPKPELRDVPDYRVIQDYKVGTVLLVEEDFVMEFGAEFMPFTLVPGVVDRNSKSGFEDAYWMNVYGYIISVGDLSNHKYRELVVNA